MKTETIASLSPSSTARPYTGRSLISDADLVPISLICTSCKKQHEVALPGDAILRRVLAMLACPSCETIGVLRLVRKGK